MAFHLISPLLVPQCEQFLFDTNGLASPIRTVISGVLTGLKLARVLLDEAIVVASGLDTVESPVHGKLSKSFASEVVTSTPGCSQTSTLAGVEFCSVIAFSNLFLAETIKLSAR
eukprot:GHVR01189103.1.p3 GENE.GHVR01189103.1~~GHVR01189103.1.p3  ORF type:complete len:114 (-),score=4.42 GHVR01189103.1:419-760(-)